MLGLELNLVPFYSMARQEPKLAHVESQCLGRILRSPTLFEDVIKTLLTTNTLWAATKRMNNNLIDLYGDPLPDDADRRAFPTPQALAAAGEADLRQRGRLGYRAPYVLSVAEAFVADNTDLKALKDPSLPTPEIRQRLRQLRGIGPYAAANLLMLLGRFDDLPVNSWAMKMVSQEWYGGSEVTEKMVRQHFERFGEFQGMAYWFWKWDHP